MGTSIVVMPLEELVELVNLAGTVPCEVDGRRPAGDTGLADALYPVFAAPDDTTRAALVTALLDATRVRPALQPEGGTLTETWTVDDPAQAPRAAAALALRHHLAEHPGRAGICADDQCADVYIDASPAGRRRFCCVTCQNRARAAAFRRRAKSRAD